MRSTSARSIALGGILGAVAIVIMCLGGLIPVATFVCPILCMLLLVVVSAIFYIGTPIGLEVMVLVIALSISGFWRHRGNIKRLIRGEEVKMGQKVKIEQEDKKKEE